MAPNFDLPGAPFTEGGTSSENGDIQTQTEQSTSSNNTAIKTVSGSASLEVFYLSYMFSIFCCYFMDVLIVFKEPVFSREEESTTGSINRMCRALNVPSQDSLEIPPIESVPTRKRARRETE